jgi:hypothetical protein
MEDTRMMLIESLKARVTSADYQVDAHAVAEAILVRPGTRLWLLRSEADGGSAAASAEVSEASA